MRVTTVTASPRRTASSTIADPTKPGVLPEHHQALRRAFRRGRHLAFRGVERSGLRARGDGTGGGCRRRKCAGRFGTEAFAISSLRSARARLPRERRVLRFGRPRRACRRRRCFRTRFDEQSTLVVTTGAVADKAIRASLEQAPVRSGARPRRDARPPPSRSLPRSAPPPRSARPRRAGALPADPWWCTPGFREGREDRRDGPRGGVPGRPRAPAAPPGSSCPNEYGYFPSAVAAAERRAPRASRTGTPIKGLDSDAEKARYARLCSKHRRLADARRASRTSS